MAAGSKRVKVLIVDDHPLIREGLAARISAQPDMEVCGEAADAQEALELALATHPELMIVDITLQGGHGLDLIGAVKAKGLRAKILVLSAHEESLYAERAIQAGAHGYVNKQEAQQRVISALRTVREGEYYLSPALAARLASRAAGRKKPGGGPASLSNRELQIFQLIGQGRSTREIAEQLGLSVHTIETHRENIRGKLDLRTGAELVQRAVRWVVEHGA